MINFNKISDFGIDVLYYIVIVIKNFLLGVRASLEIFNLMPQVQNT